MPAKTIYAPAKTILTQVKLGFLELITPKASEDGGTPKYSAQLIMSKESQNFRNMYGQCADLALEVFGGEWKDLLESKMIRFPFTYDKYEKTVKSKVMKKVMTKAEAAEKYAVYKDMVTVEARSAKQPQVYNPGDFKLWFGCTGNVVVQLASYDTAKSIPGITAYLQGIYITNGVKTEQEDLSELLGAPAADEIFDKEPPF